MKVIIGSVIVILLLGFGIWLMLSPSFEKIGETAEKMKGKLEEDKNGERDTNQEIKKNP